jgi:hypothetical protein
MALILEPYLSVRMDEFFNYSFPHIYVDARELFFNGRELMGNLFNQLRLPLDQSRLDSWLPIYYNWQAKQSSILKFSWSLDHICECIVNNLYYDLTTFNLNLKQEAIIQHIMIYKYGLNFKTWGLEKFPSNTQDLHKLLEPNIHQLNNLYNKEST